MTGEQKRLANLAPPNVPVRTEREMSIARGLLAYWRANPDALHEFRAAIFGDHLADKMRDQATRRATDEENKGVK